MKRLPTISPLKLIRKTEPFDHPDWIFELKHDGFRSIAYISGDGCRLVSRRSNRFRSFNLLSESLGNLPVIDAVLDGELVCLDNDGRSLFNELMFRRSQRCNWIFCRAGKRSGCDAQSLSGLKGSKTIVAFF